MMDSTIRPKLSRRTRLASDAGIMQNQPTAAPDLGE
jgi:hypothetical protein